jgi:hypothetical protein
MKLLSILNSKLPVLRKTQACEGCGQSFACEISLGTGCWCTQVKLSEGTRHELRAKYNACLCRNCLEKAEATHLASEAKANTHD